MSRILLVSLNHAPETTGVGRFNGEMVAWLAARGHAVRVVTAPPYYPMWRIAPRDRIFLPRREERDGARVYRVPLYVPRRASGPRRLLHLASFAATSAPVILALALSWRPQLILVTEPSLAAAPAVLLAARLCRARTLLHVQDFEVDAAFDLGIVRSPAARRLAEGVEARLMAGFTHVSTISRRMVDRLAAKGVEPSRTLLLPNWADLERIRPDVDPGPWRRRLAAGERTVIALYSGNIGRKQGLETVVEAARRLWTEPSIRFVICGAGAGLDDLAVAAQGLTNVTFLPLQPEAELPGLLAAADVHLLPQRAGAADLVMPSKLANMLASGRPVIAGAEPGTQVFEAIQGCGLAVRPEDAGGLTAALRALAESRILRQNLGRAARHRAVAQFGREAALRGLAELTGEVVEESVCHNEIQAGPFKQDRKPEVPAS